MKKITFLLIVATMVTSCTKTTKTETTIVVKDTINQEKNDEASKVDAAFSIENLPVSAADIGDFPFFTLPKGLTNQNKPLQKNFDVCYFPVNGIMTPFEGKLYKINVVADKNETFSQRYFEKSMEDYLTSIGAVKVFDGEIAKEEYDRYNKQDPNKGDEGDIGYTGQNIKFYALRTKDKGTIYVQFSSNNASGKLNILQEEAFTQTIEKVTSDDIAKDLAEKGKSILYINFDVDKSNVTADGKEVIDQIAGALKKEPLLKIAIEGHTDNTGDAAHNKKLSNDRANTVLNALVSNGIEKTRLSAKGFGAERPLVANDSEDNKAKNRRVELVKVN